MKNGKGYPDGSIVIHQLKASFQRIKKSFNTMKGVLQLVYNRSYRLFEHGREFKLWAKICGTAYPLELGDRQLKLLKKAEKIGEAKLLKRDGEWYLHVFIEVKEAEPLNPKGVLGVDLGLRNSAVVTGSKPVFIKHRHLLYKVSYYWKQIDLLKSKLPKGRRTSKRIKRLWRKIARINQFIAHDTSAKNRQARLGSPEGYSIRET